MISIMTEKNFNLMMMCYESNRNNRMIELDSDIISNLHHALVDKSYVVHNASFTGFLIMFPYDSRLALNPWFLNGYPIGQDPEILLDEAKAYYRISKYKRLELIGEANYLQDKDISIPHVYDYVDLEKKVKMNNRIRNTFKHISDYDENHLKEVYHDAFSNGDAVFYKLQTSHEKKGFWKYLNYEKAVIDPCSLAIEVDNKVVAFVFAYNQNASKHISCMCVLKEFQHQGLGRLLLDKIETMCLDMGIEYMTLGTETSMKAYELYMKSNFYEVNKKKYYILKG